MTREIYTHVTDTMPQEAGDAIERIIGDGDANGSSIGSNEEQDPENDEGYEPEDRV
jgi:hypothetical protein